MEKIEKAKAPTAVTIPYDRRMEEIELLKEASEFQPELYRLISQRATREELQIHADRIVNLEKNYMNQTLQKFSKDCQQMIDQLKAISEQDGKDRERFTSECSSALKAERDKLSVQMEEFRKRSRRLLIAVFITAIALSALVSYLLYRVLV